jgi:hypothetical protein
MKPSERPRLDIVNPVSNEGANILCILQSLTRDAMTSPRVLNLGDQ